jgi:hypothetical protein
MEVISFSHPPHIARFQHTPRYHHAFLGFINPNPNCQESGRASGPYRELSLHTLSSAEALGVAPCR